MGGLSPPHGTSPAKGLGAACYSCTLGDARQSVLQGERTWTPISLMHLSKEGLGIHLPSLRRVCGAEQQHLSLVPPVHTHLKELVVGVHTWCAWTGKER